MHDMWWEVVAGGLAANTDCAGHLDPPFVLYEVVTWIGGAFADAFELKEGIALVCI